MSTGVKELRSLQKVNRSMAPGLLIRGALAGLTSGIVLAFILKGAQKLTSELVYTLLLNIDFVAFMPKRLPEAVELALHLAVSIPLGIIYLVAVSYTGYRFLVGIVLGLAAGCIWIPLTLVSVRVPSIFDGRALLLWLIAHIVYGCILALFAGRSTREYERHKTGSL
ncbi:hypothetical protein ACFPYJ_30540 [Paenibacillus solisilvae]|uniref:DUF1440 domain-containing protein n=1 Tax=Paenibacillus solisilvae TaxID=2486751 RepID=A0ABW0W8J0_9BACL